MLICQASKTLVFMIS